MHAENISYFVAFTAGVLTFLSPCILPLIPSFIAYMTGVSFSELKSAGQKESVRAKAALHTAVFILGFSLVFILLGMTASFIGKALFRYQKVIQIAGGGLIIFFGLVVAGAIRFDFLMKEHRFSFTKRGATYLGSFLVGVTFAAAWTPCAGPILGSILALAGTRESSAQGGWLLAVYSLGLGLPFFIAGVMIDSFIERINRFTKVVRIVSLFGGIFLIIIGLLMMTGYLAVVSDAMMRFFMR